MTTLWRSLVCLFRRDGRERGFRGDDTTAFLSDAIRHARDQEVAARREEDRILRALQERRGVAELIGGSVRRD